MDPRPIIMSGELISSATHSVVAAEFESCMQTFQSLCAAMEANHQIWEKQEYDRLYESQRTLLSWAESTGAANRSLDHALRKNSRLRKAILELLESLNGSLQSIMDSVQVTATPLLSPAPQAAFENPRMSYFDLVPQQSSRFQGLPISEQSMLANFEDISSTLERLNRLRSSLIDPFPLDLFYTGAKDSDNVTDVSQVTKLFPKAPDFLKQRLGKANWQRRRFLRALRSERGSKPNQPLRTPGSSVRSPMLSPHASPYKQNTQQKFQQKSDHRAILGRMTSRATSVSEGTSYAGTWWSKADSVTNYTATSIGDGEDGGKSEMIMVPPPPVTLEIGACFLCPYCGQYIIVGESHTEPAQRWQQQIGGEKSPDDLSRNVDLNAPRFKVLEVTSTADWSLHVFADLEPYVCTSVQCLQATKTFGSVEDWFDHEIHNHRTKVWHCQMCDEEFKDPGTFSRHLEARHMLSADQSDLLLDLCERYAEKTAPRLDCPLCALVCSTLESFRAHVSNHLELIALTSIEEEERYDDTAPLSSTDTTRSRESADKVKRLEEFIFSQVNRFQLPNSLNARMRDSSAQHNQQQAAVPAKDQTNNNDNNNTSRPQMTPRGPSYTYLSNIRRQNTDPNGIQEMLAAAKLDDNNVPAGAVRTNPPPRNVDFVGRIDYMANVHHDLSKPGNICVISGVGGLGKSALAAEYTYRFEAEYSYIFWVQAETAMICADTYSQIAVVTRTTAELPNEEQRLVTLSREFLEQTKRRWLLVFDNVDERQDLTRFLPIDLAGSTGSVLITTNKEDIGLADLPYDYSQIDLSPLSLDDSRRLLLSSANLGTDLTALKLHPEYHLAGEIAKRAEKLPLALSLIAGYIMVSQCKLSDFVEIWNERRKNVRSPAQASKSLSSNADQAMETVWDIGLREVSSDAQKLLNILAFLDPDSIQKDLLVGEHDEPCLELLHSSEATRYKRMTRELKNRRLVAVETKNGEEIISIHRKLQSKILRDLNKDVSLRERVFRQIFMLVRGRFPSASAIQVPEPDKWPICKKYLPHVLSIERLTRGTTIEIPASIDLARLYSDGGIDLWERGMTLEGLELLRAAEAMLDQLQSEEKLLRANIHVIISLLLQDSGMTYIGECKDRAETALKIRRDYRDECDSDKYTKNDEILLYNAWSDYGCVLLQFNNFEEAEPMFAQCVKQYQKWGAPETIPYEYAKYYHHMAHCLMYEGEMEEAISHAEQGLHWVRVATGESAATYRWKFDMACIVLQSGDLTRALELHIEILQARTRLHGKHGFLTLESKYAVGAIYAYLGQYEEAEAQLRQILEFEQVRPGSCNQAALARTRYHLSQILISREEGSQVSQHPASDTAGTETSQHVATSLRLQEAVDLAKMAKKVLDKSYNQEMRLITSAMDMPSVSEDNHLVLYDLMQSVFDGRFTGLDVLKFLRVAKGDEVAPE